MPSDVRCVVIGTGALGSAAAFWLARRIGKDTHIVEQFEPGHTRGASEDHSRIIRHSYHATRYTHLTRAMYECWDELEALTGVRLVVRTGGIDLAQPGVPDSLEEYEQNAAAMTAAGICFEPLDAAELMRRQPQWRLADDAVALFQAESGILDVRQACAAHLALARAHGATIASGTPVTRLEPRDDGVLVHTGGSVIAAEHVVVCAGKWTNRVLGELHQLPLHYTREQVTYFASPRMRDFAPERFGVWIRLGEPSFYGFPVYGLPAVKAAQDLGGPPVDVDDGESAVDVDRIEPVRAFLAAHLPDALGPPALSRSCVYDLTPDRDFVIDALPGHPRVHVAVGAGHAAKFGGLIGRILSELVLDGSTELPIGPFRADRWA